MIKRRPERLSWFRWWRRWLLQKFKPKRTCINCGFLAFGGNEADAASRIQLSNEGSVGGLPEPVAYWGCAKKQWLWELGYGAPNWDAVLEEVNNDKRDCRYFLHHSPGRSPSEHFQLENASKEFHQKLILALLSGSIGVVVGWFLNRWLH